MSAKLCLLSAAVVLAAAVTTANAELTHRYSFTDGAKDSVGKVDAALKGAAKVADGKLVLANENKTAESPDLSFVEFSGPLLPKSGSVTLAFWFSAKDTGTFARVFNYGNTDNGAGSAFIYFTPATADGQSRAAISASDTASKTNIDGPALDDGKPHCAVIVVDGAAKKLRYFVDGKPIGAGEDLGENTLDKVQSNSRWIGKSSFVADAGLSASVDEFRVYDNALSADQVAALAKAGPDKVEPAPASTTQPAPAK